MDYRKLIGETGVSRATVTLLEDMTLTLARAHEFCGNARRTLALLTAMRTAGTILWIVSRHQRSRLNPEGLLDWVNPGRLLFVAANHVEDLFWTAEESLRSGIVPLTILDLQRPAALTPVRRLHLAAEAGQQRGQVLPMCLLLVPGQGGALGVESRWSCECRHSRSTNRWHVERQRSRGQMPADWLVTREGDKWHICKPEYEQKEESSNQSATLSAN